MSGLNSKVCPLFALLELGGQLLFFLRSNKNVRSGVMYIVQQTANKYCVIQHFDCRYKI